MSEMRESDLFFDDDEFDPLAADDLDIDQEDMDDDNPLDTVDYPTMRNMPEGMQREAVYTPERQGSAKEAILAMFDRNPARRPVLIAIINMCREGSAASQVSEQVNALQKDNQSVYAPMTLCRMLERAGALELEMPETAEEKETPEGDAEYLEIKERVDPVWRSTDAAIEVADEFARGGLFRDIILTRDATYKEVYVAVMKAAADGSSKAAIDALVDEFPIVKEPRRFGGHFIDMLERCDAIIWQDRAWHLTDLGQAMLEEMEA